MTDTLHNLRFGSTTISFYGGDPLDQPREAIYVSINARAVMASGLAGAIRRAAGQDIERELRSKGTLLPGTAYVVGPGQLVARGIARIACGVTTASPGLPPKRASVLDAFRMALDLLVDERTTTLTLPEIGTRIPEIELRDAANILTNTLAARLRRGSRFTGVVIAGLHPEYLRHCHDQLTAAGAKLE